MTTIGQILRRERLKKKLSFSDIEAETKIKATFLEAVERGEYDKLPSSAYAQGFVTSYAQFLKVPKNQALALFKREFDDKLAIGVLPKGLTTKTQLHVRKRKLSLPLLSAIFIIVIIAIYLLLEYRYVIINPPLNVISPTDGEIVSGQNIEVVGKTDPNSTANINSQAVAVDSNGNFKSNIILFPGNDVIHVSAANRFGKQSSQDIHVEVK